MTYSTDIPSTPEFKAFEGTEEKLGGFYKMWNMLKREAEKKPQDLSITIIDIEYTYFALFDQRSQQSISSSVL
jgi:hypothetical protein